MDKDSLTSPSWYAYLLARCITSLDYCVWLVTFGPFRRLLFSGVPKATLPVMVESSKDKLYTGIWRSAKAQSEFLTGPEWSPESSSIYDLFLDAATKFPSNKCFGIRPILGEEATG